MYSVLQIFLSIPSKIDMCGISGIISNHPDGFVNETALRRMCGVLRHRGPDDEGWYLDPRAGLGIRRLSIIDLVSGRQPVTNENRSLWLVYNGEIYNYRELRDQLEKRGHVFSSHSDTEVIIHAYEEYGDRCVEHFNGMFSLAVWDTSRRRLFMARDRLGIKPLYYWTQGERLVFGSELKAVIAHSGVPRRIDLVALDQFLTLEYIPSPYTIFEGIRKLPPGHLLVFQDGHLCVEQFWDVAVQAGPVDEGTCVEALSDLIRDAVRLQLVSDVPLGAFLSGGIDSSTVVACMSEAMSVPVRTFSIGFGDETYNELPYARAVASRFGSVHHEEFLHPNVADLAERLVSHLDEPLGDFSILPTYLVSEVASRSVKVVLSGDGGDEIFAGYDTYVAQSFAQIYQMLPAQLRQTMLPALMARVPPQPSKKGLVNRAKRFVEGAALPASMQHTRWMMFMSPVERAALYLPEVCATLNGNSPASVMEQHFRQSPLPDPLAQQQYVDIKTYLADNILAKVDRMSMAASVEARVPLLDHRIVEFALNLPPHLKMHRGRTKLILRRAMAGILPEIVLNKPKEGFSIPLKHWLRDPLRPMMLDLLLDNGLERHGFFRLQTIQRWVSEHLSGRANHSHRLWTLMVFEIWHRTVFASG